MLGYVLAAVYLASGGFFAVALYRTLLTDCCPSLCSAVLGGLSFLGLSVWAVGLWVSQTNESDADG